MNRGPSSARKNVVLSFVLKLGLYYIYRRTALTPSQRGQKIVAMHNSENDNPGDSRWYTESHSKSRPSITSTHSPSGAAAAICMSVKTNTTARSSVKPDSCLLMWWSNYNSLVYAARYRRFRFRNIPNSKIGVRKYISCINWGYVLFLFTIWKFNMVSTFSRERKANLIIDVKFLTISDFGNLTISYEILVKKFPHLDGSPWPPGEAPIKIRQSAPDVILVLTYVCMPNLPNYCIVRFFLFRMARDANKLAQETTFGSFFLHRQRLFIGKFINK